MLLSSSPGHWLTFETPRFISRPFISARSHSKRFDTSGTFVKHVFLGCFRWLYSDALTLKKIANYTRLLASFVLRGDSYFFIFADKIIYNLWN